MPPPTAPLPAPSRFAALAIDRRDGNQYGWAVDYPAQSAAVTRALSECGARGSSCSVVLTFQSGCGAYVVERGNGSLYGWGTAPSLQTAQARAFSEGHARGGRDLVLRVWGCNSSR